MPVISAECLAHTSGLYLNCNNFLSQTANAMMYGNIWFFSLPPYLQPPFSPFPIPTSVKPGKSCNIPEKLHKTPEVDNIVCFKFKMLNVYACRKRRMKECPLQESYLKWLGGKVLPLEYKWCLRINNKHPNVHLQTVRLRLPTFHLRQGQRKWNFRSNSSMTMLRFSLFCLFVFWCGQFLKFFTEFVKMLFLFYVLVFWHVGS